jgi:hypothetical protein
MAESHSHRAVSPEERHALRICNRDLDGLGNVGDSGLATLHEKDVDGYGHIPEQISCGFRNRTEGCGSLDGTDPIGEDITYQYEEPLEDCSVCLGVCGASSFPKCEWQSTNNTNPVIRFKIGRSGPEPEP